MFEVGKKYKSLLISKTFECIAVEGIQAVLKSSAGFSVFWQSDFSRFEEYKEPIKHVRYFLIRKDGVLGPYSTRPSEKSPTGGVVLGVKRVEFVEGQFDE